MLGRFFIIRQGRLECDVAEQLEVGFESPHHIGVGDGFNILVDRHPRLLVRFFWRSDNSFACFSR